MSRRRRHPLDHPLLPAFLSAAQSVTVAMGDAARKHYRITIEHFLRYLGAHHAEVTSLAQLRRDPHVLGWLSWLAAKEPRIEIPTRTLYIISARRLMEELAWLHEFPSLVRLFHPDDIPPRNYRLPRPLSPEQDRLIQQELLRRNDVASNALLLVRHTGMRLGECADLAFDCLRQPAPGQWSLHVPLGKLHTERLVPVDESVCQIVHRLRFFRSLSSVPLDGLLLARRHNRNSLLRELRVELTKVRTDLGIERLIVPHMFRHTYATEMLRSGVSLQALMKLLGHSTAKMTLLYAEFTQADLQREWNSVRSQPRHLAPPPRTALSASAVSHADLPSLIHAVQVAQHVLEMFRRTLPDNSASVPVLDRLANRLARIATELRKFTTG
jgi:integrase